MSGTKARLSKPEAKVFSDGNIFFLGEGGEMLFQRPWAVTERHASLVLQDGNI